MQRILQCLFCLMLPLLPALSAAELVEDLYAAEIPVKSRSAGDLKRLAPKALAEVLVRVSGETQLLEREQLAGVLDEPERYVQQYGYRGEGDSLSLVIEFDAAAVAGLLSEAGAPVWTANRPPALIWAVVSDGDRREFVTPDTFPGLAEALEVACLRRGVPLRWPMLDLADLAALSPGQAWRLDVGALAGASSRYGVQDILAGRLAVSSEGLWLGDWAYLNRGSERVRSVTTREPAELAATGVDLLADAMAARYALTANAAGDDRETRLRIDGILGFGDLVAVQAWLRGLELVDAVRPERIEGDSVILRMQARAAIDELVPLIELNRELQVMAPAGDGLRRYRWNP